MCVLATSITLHDSRVIVSPSVDAAPARLLDAVSLEVPMQGSEHAPVRPSQLLTPRIGNTKQLAHQLHHIFAIDGTVHKAVRYARKYKLIFSLLNEDVAKGGVTSWRVREALTRKHLLLCRLVQD